MAMTSGGRTTVKPKATVYKPKAKVQSAAAKMYAPGNYAYTPNPRNDPANWYDSGGKTAAGYPNRTLKTTFAGLPSGGAPPGPF
jgi:hypothetical protein